jgi:hypothetical protein
MSTNNIHDEWLSLVEISGPFLAPPVLKEAFPQGLDLLDPGKRKRLRQTYEEWREALDSEDQEFSKLHSAWIKEVISNCLGFDEDGKGAHLKRGSSTPSSLAVQIPEQGVTLVPEYVLVDEQHENKPLLLIQSYANGIDLQASMSVDGWSASPADRMVQLCRLTGCRLGLVTDGERWMLIDAPVGAVTTFASWYARIWIQEPITLQAFVHLLGIRRFFVALDEQIPALIDKSLQHQDEVTTALGEQVQRAVEVLIQSLDRADQDRNRELLRDVTPAELYEAGLTVMMRLVFLLSAEERGLLLMGDECYEKNYAISTLRMQLCSESEEILERRWDAWSRLLSVFRAVYGGIDHENMRLPALGGSLFDPDQFSFLEGRAKGSDWYKESAKPLPIDNRTVLLLLEAIQQYQGRTLSYKALDVEQIGYVYEGLLDRTVGRVPELTLEFDGSKAANNPWISLSELDNLSEIKQIELIHDRSGISSTRIANQLGARMDEDASSLLLTACQGDLSLYEKIKRFGRLLKTDSWGYPLVYPAGSFAVTSGSSRKETGAHYTPKSLTELVVREALIPVVYEGPSTGLDRADWVLKSPDQLLDLKICDPAMGSGAFLVQACRWLSDRLVESWAKYEHLGGKIGIKGDLLLGDTVAELLPNNAEERLIIARRQIAECCLYGVDLNPLAVELSKLSIWLITLAKDRPFGFLDHNFRSGDSLLGLHSLDQITHLNLKSVEVQQQRLFGKAIEESINEALSLRLELRNTYIRDIADIRAMESLNLTSKIKLATSELVANSLVGEALRSGDGDRDFEESIERLAIQVGKLIDGNPDELIQLQQRASENLSVDLPPGANPRNPFHWLLEFPEVFNRPNSGFDVVIGNPPYFAGSWLTTLLGAAYRSYLVKWIAEGVTGLRGTADLCTYFIRRIQKIVKKKSGVMGLVLSSSVAEGDSKAVGLSGALNNGAEIFRCSSKIKWPGSASVEIFLVWLIASEFKGSKFIGDIEVPSISAALNSDIEVPEPNELLKNQGLICKGHELQGDGFKISAIQKVDFEIADPKSSRMIFPLITGDWINNSTGDVQEFVINFQELNLLEAQNYQNLFEWVEKNVKPERMLYVGMTSRDVYLRTNWWLFRGFRSEIKTYAASHSKMLAFSVVSKYLIFRFIDANSVPTAATSCIFSESYGMFAQLQSSIHEIWARNFGSSLGYGLRYIAGRCFKTYPFLPHSDNLEALGKMFYELRSNIMQSREIGLTDVYNLFHSMNVYDEDIVALRECQIEIDLAIKNLYGLAPLDLDHDFYRQKYLPENDCVRFFPSDDARLAVIECLSKLNAEVYSCEMNQNSVKKSRPKKTKEKLANDTSSQPEFKF